MSSSYPLFVALLGLLTALSSCNTPPADAPPRLTAAVTAAQPQPPAGAADTAPVAAQPTRTQPAQYPRLQTYFFCDPANTLGLPSGNGRVYSRTELTRQWVGATLAASRESGEYVVIIDKSAYRLYLISSGDIATSCTIELGASPHGDKRMEGDMATPEGIYHVVDKRDTGETKYYRGFLLDYPNADDRREFRHLKTTGEVPADATIGGGIMLHGLGSGLSPDAGGENWTHGCVALSNADMDAVFPFIEEGTRIVIVSSIENSCRIFSD